MKATRSAAQKTNIVVVGTITVFNPNVDANGDTIPVEHVTVTDHLSNDVECVVDDRRTHGLDRGKRPSRIAASSTSSATAS